MNIIKWKNENEKNILKKLFIIISFIIIVFIKY